MENFIFSNLPWIITLVFGAGGLAWSVKSLGGRIEGIHTKFTELDNRDRDHEKELAEQKSKIAVLEARVEVLDHLVQRVDDIWKHVIRSGANIPAE